MCQQIMLYMLDLHRANYIRDQTPRVRVGLIACLLMHGTSNCRDSVARDAPFCTATVTTIFSEHCIAIDCACMGHNAFPGAKGQRECTTTHPSRDC